MNTPKPEHQFCSDCGAEMNFENREDSEVGDFVSVTTMPIVEGSKPEPTEQKPITEQKAEPQNHMMFISETKKPKILEFVDNEPIKSAWNLDIQESKQFLEQGVVVATNKKGKKIHLKKGSKQTIDGQEYTELVPLNIDELRSLKIEESLNEKMFDLTIEESIEEEQKKRVTAQFNSNDIEDMRKAKEQAEQRIRELGGSTEQKLDVAERDNQLFEQIKSKAEESYQNLGLNAPKIEDVDDLNNAIENLKTLKAKGEHNPASGGSASLEGQYSQQNEGFGSYPEMIDSLRDKASPQNANVKERQEAQKIIDTLMTKAILGQRQTNKAFDFNMPKDQSLSDLLAEKYRRRKALGRGS